jgi:RNA polymerase sigma factor (sigma-70 family)
MTQCSFPILLDRLSSGPLVMTPEESPIPNNPAFATTCWSEVRRAALLTGDANESLERLCAAYWYPLYAFLRRSGHNPADSQDYVQSFFVDLLARDSLQSADPSRGRFRSFLLTACRNHVANLKRADRALVRGGGHRLLPIESYDGETIYQNEPVENWSPEKLYERQWALAVIEGALKYVRQQYDDKGKVDRFDALCPLVAPASQPPTHAEVANQLKCSEGSVKVAAHRLRQQFGSALRAEISQTIDIHADPHANGLGDDPITEELQFLLSALRGE